MYVRASAYIMQFLKMLRFLISQNSQNKICNNCELWKNCQQKHLKNALDNF